MTQKIFGLGLGGTGIVAVLVIVGIILTTTKINVDWGQIAIVFGILIGIIFGILGIFGILKRLGA